MVTAELLNGGPNVESAQSLARMLACRRGGRSHQRNTVGVVVVVVVVT